MFQSPCELCEDIRQVRASRDSGRDIERCVLEAAQIMMTRTLNYPNGFPADHIVDPRVLGRRTPGRHGKPGMAQAIEAMELCIAHGYSVRGASTHVAELITAHWKAWTRPVTWSVRTSLDGVRETVPRITQRRRRDLEKLGWRTLPEALRAAYYRERRRKN